MANLLKPHTDGWFEALEKVNPRQARITRLIVEASGHANVCSICGMPAPQDFSIPNKEFRDGSPMTMRLCAHCAGLEKAEILRAG